MPYKKTTFLNQILAGNIFFSQRGYLIPVIWYLWTFYKLHINWVSKMPPVRVLNEMRLIISVDSQIQNMKWH